MSISELPCEDATMNYFLSAMNTYSYETNQCHLRTYMS